MDFRIQQKKWRRKKYISILPCQLWPSPCKDNRQEPVDNRQEPLTATLEFGRKKVIFETWDPSDIWS